MKVFKKMMKTKKFFALVLCMCLLLQQGILDVIKVAAEDEIKEIVLYCEIMYNGGNSFNAKKDNFQISKATKKGTGSGGDNVFSKAEKKVLENLIVGVEKTWTIGNETKLNVTDNYEFSVPVDNLYMKGYDITEIKFKIVPRIITSSNLFENVVYVDQDSANIAVVNDSYILEGVCGDDEVRIVTDSVKAKFVDWKKGDYKKIIIEEYLFEGEDASNYKLDTIKNNYYANITEAEIPLEKLENLFQNKEFDGNATAYVNNSKFKIHFNGKDITISNVVAKFVDSEGKDSVTVGEKKSIKILSYDAYANAGEAYSIPKEGYVADIDRKKVEVQSNGVITKEYDGTTNVREDFMKCIEINNLVEGYDKVSLEIEEAKYQSENINDEGSKIVDIKGMKLFGDDSHNYVLSSTDTAITGEINQANLSFIPEDVELDEYNFDGNISFGYEVKNNDGVTIYGNKWEGEKFSYKTYYEETEGEGYKELTNEYIHSIFDGNNDKELKYKFVDVQGVNKNCVVGECKEGRLLIRHTDILDDDNVDSLYSVEYNGQDYTGEWVNGNVIVSSNTIFKVDKNDVSSESGVYKYTIDEEGENTYKLLFNTTNNKKKEITVKIDNTDPTFEYRVDLDRSKMDENVEEYEELKELYANNIYIKLKNVEDSVSGLKKDKDEDEIVYLYFSDSSVELEEIKKSDNWIEAEKLYNKANEYSAIDCYETYKKTGNKYFKGYIYAMIEDQAGNRCVKQIICNEGNENKSEIVMGVDNAVEEKDYTIKFYLGKEEASLDNVTNSIYTDKIVVTFEMDNGSMYSVFPVMYSFNEGENWHKLDFCEKQELQSGKSQYTYCSSQNAEMGMGTLQIMIKPYLGSSKVYKYTIADNTPEIVFMEKNSPIVSETITEENDLKTTCYNNDDYENNEDRYHYYFQNSMTYSVNTVDEQSGIAECKYAIMSLEQYIEYIGDQNKDSYLERIFDNSTTLMKKTEVDDKYSFTISLSEGESVKKGFVVFCVKDRSGNITYSTDDQIKLSKFIISNEIPEEPKVKLYTNSEKRMEVKSGTWMNSDIMAVVDVSNIPQAGIKYIKYRSQNESEWLLLENYDESATEIRDAHFDIINNAIVFTDDQSKKYEFVVVSNSEVYSKIHEIEIKVDKTLPTVEAATTSDENVKTICNNTDYVANENKYHYYFQNSMTYSVNTVDEQSGIVECKYAIMSFGQYKKYNADKNKNSYLEGIFDNSATLMEKTEVDDKYSFTISLSEGESVKKGFVVFCVKDRSGNITYSTDDQIELSKFIISNEIPEEPKVKLYTNSEKRMEVKSGQWVNSNIIAIVNELNTPEAGIKCIKYKLDNGGWNVLSKYDASGINVQDSQMKLINNAIEINGDGKFTCKFKVVTNTDLESPELELKMYIDKKEPCAPQIYFKGIEGDEVANKKNTKWIISDLEIYSSYLEENEGENTSNVSTFYMVKKKGEEVKGKFEKKIPKISEDGIYEISAYTIDEANNDSSIITKTLYYDTNAPYDLRIGYSYADEYKVRPIVKLHPLQLMVTKDYFNKRIAVIMQAKDDTSGVKSFNYSIAAKRLGDNKVEGILKAVRDDAEENIYKAVLYVEPSMLGCIKVDVVDNAGFYNGEKTDRVIVVDNAQPTAPTVVATTDKELSSGEWTPNNIKLTISDSYALAGIEKYEYKKTTDEEWKELTLNPVETKATKENPYNLKSVQLILNQDEEIIYEFRAISNTGISGKVKRFDVKRDSIAPVIEAAFDSQIPSNTKYYNENRVLNVVIEELNFDANDVNIQITKDNVNYTKYQISSWENSDISNRAQILLSQSGDYTVNISYTDKAGNVAKTYVSEEFTIDKEEPSISLTYNKNNDSGYYNETRVATITVYEHNFDAKDVKVDISAVDKGQNITIPKISVWTSNGDTHTATITFDKDASYTVDVSYSDLALNVADAVTTSEFIIDKTAPIVTFNGVQNKTANDFEITIDMVVTDTNLSEDALSYYVIKKHDKYDLGIKSQKYSDTRLDITFNTLTEDSSYTFGYTLTDMAGNTVDAEYEFSVNINGPTFKTSNVDESIKNNGYASKDYIPIIEISDVDTVTIMSVAVNGLELIEGVDYEFGKSDDIGILKFTNPINKSGNYTITVDVKDAAGNIGNMEPFSFKVDSDAPRIIIGGIEQAETYYEGITVTIKTENENDEITQIVLNGEVLDESQFTYLTGKSVVALELSEFDKYTLKVIAKDAAGNESESDEYEFKIEKSVIEGVSNTYLFIAIGVFAFIIGAVVCIIVVKKKKKK